MERVPGSAFQPLSTGRRKAAFRKLITEISEHLLAGEVTKCSFIHNLPKERSSSALDTLEYLLQNGAFSHSNVEPLVKLLKDINRHDLVNEQVESFCREFPANDEDDELSQSLPGTSITQRIPLDKQSNTVPADIAHTGIPPSLAIQETASTALSHVVNTTPAPSLQRPSHEPFPRQECRTPQNLELPPPTPQQVQGELNPESAEALTSHTQRSYIPVKWNEDEVSPHEKKEFSQSNSSSFNELQHYASQSSDNFLESTHTRPYSQPEGSMYQSVVTPTDIPTTPPANGTQPKLRRGGHLSCTKPDSGLFMTASPLSLTPQQTQQRRESMGARSMSESRAQRSVTPPANLNKRISEPNFPPHNCCTFNSMAKHLTGGGRPGSRTSGWSEASQPSPSRFLSNHNPQDDSDVFPHSQQSSQPDGNEASPIHHTAQAEARPDSGKLFRKRLGSKKKILSKLTRTRDHSSSTVTWSVKRRKLNEAIYEHRKTKLFKCPQELELENGGKHSPRLTVYLHPYGYEEDAQKNLTLSVKLEASAKCLISSSAVIRMEISASESTGGRNLKHAVLECPVDSRIARYKAFLSHKELRELECDRIEFTASAKLYATSLTD